MRQRTAPSRRALATFDGPPRARPEPRRYCSAQTRWAWKAAAGALPGGRPGNEIDERGSMHRVVASTAIQNGRDRSIVQAHARLSTATVPEAGVPGDLDGLELRTESLADGRPGTRRVDRDQHLRRAVAVEGTLAVRDLTPVREGDVERRREFGWRDTVTWPSRADSQTARRLGADRARRRGHHWGRNRWNRRCCRGGARGPAAGRQHDHCQQGDGGGPHPPSPARYKLTLMPVCSPCGCRMSCAGSPSGVST